MPIDNYIRKGRVVRVYDGDTITVAIDVGFHGTFTQNIRFNRIDAPELNTEEGKVARDYLKSLLPVGELIATQTYKDPSEKYGRWLGEVWTSDGRNINDLMISSGNATPYDGGKK